VKVRVDILWFAGSSTARRRLTLRSNGRVDDKVPSSYTCVRAAQLNR
jgi:hypothetical protein